MTMFTFILRWNKMVVHEAFDRFEALSEPEVKRRNMYCKLLFWFMLGVGILAILAAHMSSQGYFVTI